MPKLDRYLSREFAQSVLAAFVVLGLISLGGVFADLLSEIARGRVPAGLMLSQLGLRILTFLPILLPLSLMLGILLAMGRLYRDSEMPVLSSVGVGPEAAAPAAGGGRRAGGGDRRRCARCGWGRRPCAWANA